MAITAKDLNEFIQNNKPRQEAEARFLILASAPLLILLSLAASRLVFSFLSVSADRYIVNVLNKADKN